MTTKGSLHIVTVATDIKYYMPYLIESIKRHNNELKILGLNMKWLGFSWRLKMMKEHLLKLPEDDIVCFCDAYDVLCVRDLNEMIDEFNRIKKKTNCKVIGSWDDIISNNNIIIKIFRSILFTGGIDNDIINGGVYIGVVKDLIYMYNIIEKYSNSYDNIDDQMLLNKFNQLNPGYIYNDKKAEMFYTINHKHVEIIKYNTIKNNKVFSIFNTRPFLIHAAGGGYLDEIIIKLNYKYDTKINKLLSTKIPFKQITKNIKNYLNSWVLVYKNNIILFIFIFIFLLMTIQK